MAEKVGKSEEILIILDTFTQENELFILKLLNLIISNGILLVKLKYFEEILLKF